MRSPITGKEMVLIIEPKKLQFRKEEFEIIFHSLFCEDSGESFTTTALDDLNMTQLHNQYREKYGILFPEEIEEIRSKYGVSAKKMSEILGFGINSYRQYEAGDIPSVANSNLIKAAADSLFFQNMVENATISENEKRKIISNIKRLREEKSQHQDESFLMRYFSGNEEANVYSGFRRPNFNKLAYLIRFFSNKMEPFKTKMNKLLFYSDFLSYKKTGYSITGLRYQAIQLGPVPYHYQGIYEYLNENDEIAMKEVLFESGMTGVQFVRYKNESHEKDLLSEQETAIIENVLQYFGSMTTKEIIDYSHQERGCLQNKESNSFIDYSYAFDINLKME